jgi:type VI secretion system secreted protein VgrG
LFDQYLGLWHGGGDLKLSKEQNEMLMTEYVHCSDNWTPLGPLYVNAPAPGRVRRIYQQSPGK